MTTLLLWIRRLLLLAAVALLIGGGYRACNWIYPPTPSVYKIGMDATWYPLGLYGREHSLTAFSADLLFSIARNQHFKVEIVRSGPKRLVELLDDGKVDGILSSVTPDAYTEGRYYFSDPYYRFGAVLVVRKEEDYTSLLSLPQKRIQVQRNSPILYRIALDPAVTVVPYDSPLVAIQDLVNDRADGVLMEQLLGYIYFAGIYRDKLKVATLPLTQEGLRMITSQEANMEGFVEQFNAGLKELKESGVYQTLLTKWELYNPEVLNP